MVVVRNLFKTYGSGETRVDALNNISLTLPDKGLCFIVGQSGSGKSTLLNMLGGLDDATSGSIEIDGMNICNASISDLDDYRRDYLGIIYQNFNLFDDETVKQNILYGAVGLNKNISEEEIDSMLASVNLLKKKDMLVKNLSGGQKQRVAIIRALIKSPKIILADEPTGNLDSKSTKIIFDIIKKISNERLVVVISHDDKSANYYADRIIRLSDGQIIENLIRNDTNKDVKDIYIEDKKISTSNIDNINKQLEKFNYSLQRKDSSFIAYEDNNEVEENKSFLEKDKTKKKPSLLSGIFFKSTILSFFVISFLCALLISLLSLSSSFKSFNTSNAVNNVCEKYDVSQFILKKDYSYYNNPNSVNKDFVIPFDDKDFNKIKETGYKGNVYPIYAYGARITEKEVALTNGKSVNSNGIYDNIYATTSMGTIQCDAPYLKKLFGDFEVLAGSLDECISTTKLVVTDYIADSLIYYNFFDGNLQSSDINDPYQNIINVPLKSGVYSYYTIGAVISTNYSARYKYIFDCYDKANKDKNNSSKIIGRLTNSNLYSRFIEELNCKLNYTYTINPDFKNDYIKNCPNTIAYCQSMTLTLEESGNIVYSNSQYSLCPASIDPLNSSSQPLLEGECIISQTLFDTIFKDYETSQLPNMDDGFYVVLDNYAFNQKTTELPRTSLRLKVVKVLEKPKKDIELSSNDFVKIASNMTEVFAVALDDMATVANVMGLTKTDYFYNRQTSFEKVFELTNIINIFSSIFSLIEILLLLIILVLIMSYSLRIIRHNQYKIGVLRSLGYSNNNISLSLLLNAVILIGSIFILALGTCLLCSNIVNSLLVDSFSKFLNSDIYAGLLLIKFDLLTTLKFIGIVFVASSLAMIIPLATLRKIKPSIIIRNAE